MRGRFTVHGWIVLRKAEVFRSAMAIVGLDDVSYVDRPAVRIAETVIAPIDGLKDRIPFRFDGDEKLLTGNSFAVSAAIRCSDNTRLRHGDFLTTTAHPWLPGEDRELLLAVSQI
jgi:uncharacterized lipoprotein YbaY